MSNSTPYARRLAIARGVAVFSVAVGFYSYFLSVPYGLLFAPIGVYYSWRLAKEAKRRDGGQEIVKQAGPVLTLWVTLLGSVMFVLLSLLLFLWLLS
jgi:hypothetical protein